MTGKYWSTIASLTLLLLACAEFSLDDEQTDPQDTETAQNTNEEDDTSIAEDSETKAETSDSSISQDTGDDEDTEDTQQSAAVCGDGQLNPSAVPAHIEDFEGGELLSTTWLQGQNYGFELTSEYVHGGAFSLHPTNGGVSSSAARISIAAYTDGTICFWIYGRSSDNWFFSDYDYLYFFIDDIEVKNWLGIHTSWKEYCTTTDPGWKTFTWEYKKDSSGSSAVDGYFIDDVRFADAYEEQCDDGNNKSGDGCSATCQTE